MLRLHKILFPVDLSERSLGAGRCVQAFAERFDAEVILLHVVEPSTYDTSVLDKVAVRKVELQLFLSAEFRPFRVQRLVLEGDPTRKIVEIAKLESVDIIMMPTHGWGVYRRFILGSVTAKVLHDVDCPVWTCGHAEQPPNPGQLQCRKILAAIDFGPEGARVLAWARNLAEAYRAELSVAHVCQTVDLGTTGLPGNDMTHLLITRAKDAISGLFEQMKLTSEIHVASGEVATTLQRVAREVKADLVIIGRSTDTAVLGRLRSNSYSIIRQAPCPVISV
jgi:nucleotide-binding universal stress UspA family protein